MKVKCPTCNTDTEWSDASPYRPFCSKRCQLIDLGEWADETNTIPGHSTPSAQDIDIDLLDELSDHSNYFSASLKNH